MERIITRGRRASRTALAIALLLLVLPVATGAQRASFEGQTSVVVVEVPVTVLSDGDPVKGLTKDNFEILDDGKKQDIIGFEEVDLSLILPGATAAEDPQVPIAARRHFLLLFDLANSDPASVVKARDAGLQLLDSLHPTDLAAVAVYSTVRGVDFVLGFSSDRRQIELAIETLGVPDLVDRKPDPLGLFLSDLPEGVGSEGSEGSGRGAGEFAEIADERIQEALDAVYKTERAAQREKVITLTKNLEAMAEVIGGIEGQKHVVYFSEGFDDTLLIGEEASQETRAATESGEIWNVSTMGQFGDTRLQNDFNGMLKTFQKAGAIVQAVDIGGLRAAGDVRPRAVGTNVLNAMAKDTGGELFDNFNNLGDAMSLMLERTSVTYLLAFQPSKLAFDGDYHKLKVKLKNAPRSARITHRDGYWAPKPFAETGAEARQLSTAQSILGGDEGGPIEVDVLAAPIHIPGQKPYVPLLVEIGGDSLLAGAAGGVAQVELFVYGFDRDGGVADFATQTLGLDLSKVGDALRQTGLKYFGHLDLPPGEYSVRVLVRHAGSGQHTLRKLALTVPDFGTAGAQAMMLPPMVPEPPGKWLLVREAPTRQREGAPYPFMAEGQPYIPAVKPVIPAKSSAPFYLPAYNLADGVAFETKLMRADGSPAKGKVALGAPQRGENGIRVAKGQLDTAGLAPGEYTLEVTVKGDPSKSSRMHFVVG